MRKLLSRIAACALLSMLFCINAVAGNEWNGQVGDLEIQLTPNSSGYGQITIDWQGYDYADKYFKIFRQSNGVDFESVQIDYSSVRNIRCLQIYPTDATKNQIYNWVETTGYGKGVISVEQISMVDFNSNPNLYLKDTDQSWKYDVIFFGTLDYNGWKDLQQSALNAVIQYVQQGKGLILGHDTIQSRWGANDDWATWQHPNFNALAPYIGIKVQNQTVGYTNQVREGTQIEIKKTGLITSYPNSIGEVGDIIGIEKQHTHGQVVTDGQVWFEFVDGGITKSVEGNVCQAFLVTYNNCAMIHTGHHDGQATDDEQKIIANLIFYCNQMTFGNYFQTDMAAVDSEQPTAPVINVNNSGYSLSSTDRGQTYYYYVQSFDKNNTQLDGVLDQSNIEQISQITGVKEYLYVVDDSDYTVVTLDNGISSNGQIQKQSLNSGSYIHVAAIDNAGNIQDTTTEQITVTIQYNKNNQAVTGSMADEVVSYNEQMIVQDNQFDDIVRYQFTGWNTEPNGTGTEINPGDTITFEFALNNQNADGVLELYAQWDTVYILTIDPVEGILNDSGIQYDDAEQVILKPGDTKTVLDPSKKGYNFFGWEIQAVG